MSSRRSLIRVLTQPFGAGRQKKLTGEPPCQGFGDRQMTAEARRQRIVQLLENEGNVKVEELAVLFEVSQVTVRKELAELEEQEMLQRTYGGAVFSHRSRFNVSFFQRLRMHAPRKDLIARAALAYIHEGDTIIIDAGSTN